jgi:hypothetical protein
VEIAMTYPFFPLSVLRAGFHIAENTIARVMLVSGHCGTCHKRVDNIVLVFRDALAISDDPRYYFENFFESLSDNCDRPIEVE